MDGRYVRQVILEGIGEEGQQRLCEALVVVVGCGALGTTIAENLVRAGIGKLRIIDGDRVELTNLQRQQLFTEEDVEHKRLKVVAAKRTLARINSSVSVEAVEQYLNQHNALPLFKDCDIVVDATDNFAVRLLMNDAALELGKPWVYGGALGYDGRVLTMTPGTKCFRCMVPEVPEAAPTCSVVGVLAAVTGTVGSIQSAEVIRYLASGGSYQGGKLIIFNLWEHYFRVVDVSADPDCPACGEGRRDFLYDNSQVYPDRIFIASKGEVYKLIGTRLLVDDFKVLTSPSGCVDVDQALYRNGDLEVKFNNGSLVVEDVREVALEKYLAQNK